ncbi:unnamed protein product [marine sediment metagenome]|uniref:Uncharacterized protein n=1 Tax=marine sediment metagenome TaxID=412755 RepID=X0Z3B0_9ZZZZ
MVYNLPIFKREMFDGDPEGLAWENAIKPECFRAIVRFEVL